MKRLYPGVLGKLFNLCKPRQTKYNLAVTTALGMWMDAIVVETEETAKLCMKYLRDQRVGTLSLSLPLSSFQTHVHAFSLSHAHTLTIFFSLSISFSPSLPPRYCSFSSIKYYSS